MVDLSAKSACAGLLPKEIGNVTLREDVFEAITSVAPLKGQEAAVSDALKEHMGAAFPKPNRATGKEGARVVWAGRGQAFVFGKPVPELAGAALTDQTDAWACVTLAGPDARHVLARLIPIDLGEAQFKRGHAARTLINHMTGLVYRSGADRYGLLVFRSMAGTLVHDLETAMEAVAARG